MPPSVPRTPCPAPRAPCAMPSSVSALHELARQAVEYTFASAAEKERLRRLVARELAELEGGL